ncbi:hypothetical protein DFH28DRAFT_931168 [Melampsora americana]|nr:hypothetical protein DFH28DRAFT_931168 [Melampsora americana]
MLFFKLAISAVLAVTVSTAITQKDLSPAEPVLQRRAAEVNTFKKRVNTCDQCTVKDCGTPSNRCYGAEKGCLGGYTELVSDMNGIPIHQDVLLRAVVEIKVNGYWDAHLRILFQGDDVRLHPPFVHLLSAL